MPKFATVHAGASGPAFDMAKPSGIDVALAVDHESRPITSIASSRLLSQNYSAAGATVRALRSGLNYRLESGRTLVNFSTPPTTNSVVGTATVTNGVTTYTRGQFVSGVRVVTGTDAGDRANLDAKDLTLPAMTAADYVLIPVYIESCNSTDQLIFWLSPNNLASTSISSTVSVTPNSLGWNFIFIPVASFVGGAAITDSHNSMRFTVRHQNAGGVPTIATMFGAVLNPRQVGRVMLDFDDDFLSQYTEVYSYCQPLNVQGSIGVIAETVGKSAGQLDTFDYCSLAQLQEMRANGWAMCTHGYTPHNGATLNSSESAITADIAANKAFIANNGMSGEEGHYIYPAGQCVYPQSRNALAQNGMLTARLVFNNMIQTSELGLSDKYALPGLSISASTGLSALQAQVDRVIASGGAQIFMGHRVVTSVADSGNEILRADFRSFIDYCVAARNAGRLDIVTRDQWFRGLEYA